MLTGGMNPRISTSESLYIWLEQLPVQKAAHYEEWVALWKANHYGLYSENLFVM